MTKQEFLKKYGEFGAVFCFTNAPKSLCTILEYNGDLLLHFIGGSIIYANKEIDWKKLQKVGHNRDLRRMERHLSVDYDYDLLYENKPLKT